MVVLAVEVEGSVGEESLEDGDALLHAVDADPGAVVLDARLFVVGVHPAGTETELDPPSREDVDGGHLLRQHDGVLVVVVEHQGAHPEVGGGIGGRHHGGHGRELIAEVVGQEQAREPEVLGLSCDFGPVRSALGGCTLDTEPELAIVSHLISS